MKPFEYRGYTITYSDDPYNKYKYMAISLDDCDAEVLYGNSIEGLKADIDTITE